MLSIKDINKDKLKILLARLQRHYDYAYPLEDAQGFFVGIADYVKAVEESDYLTAIVDAFILPEKKEKVAEIVKVSKEVIKEAEQTFKQTEKIIKDNKIDSDYVKREIEEYRSLVEGRLHIYGNGNCANHQSDNVRDILIAIRESGFEKETNSYAEFNKQGILTNWKISETEKKLNNLLERFEEHRKMSIWNAWEQLWWVFTITYNKHDHWEKLNKDNFMDIMGFGMFADDMKKIMDEKEESRDYKHFKMPEYKRHFHRVHDKIQTEADDLISALEQRAETQQEGSNFRYDNEGAMLFYKGNNVLKLHRSNSGRAKMFNALWEGKTVILDNIVVEEGKPAILRKELCLISDYSSNEGIDKAVAFFRKKLKELPIEITAEKGFRIIVKD